jgi:hypothetical protein
MFYIKYISSILRKYNLECSKIYQKLQQTRERQNQKDIDAYLLKGLGLNIENRYFYTNEYIAITDVSADGDNVLSDNDHLFFIDPIIKFKQPATVVLNHYYEEIQGSLR